MEGSHSNRISEEFLVASTEGSGYDVDSVVDGGFEGGEDIGIEALSFGYERPAGLVGGDAGFWSAAFGRAVTMAENVGSGDEVAGGSGECVGPMSIVVAYGIKSGVENASGEFISFVEIPSSNQLPDFPTPQFRSNISCFIKVLFVFFFFIYI